MSPLMVQGHAAMLMHVCRFMSANVSNKIWEYIFKKFSVHAMQIMKSISVSFLIKKFVLQMTASHLPYTRNGLKFFTRKGGLTSPEVEAICDKAARKYANRLTRVSTTLKIPLTRVDFMSTYAKHLRDIIKERVNHPLHYDTPLKGFQVPFYPFFCLFLYFLRFLSLCYARWCAQLSPVKFWGWKWTCKDMDLILFPPTCLFIA